MRALVNADDADSICECLKVRQIEPMMRHVPFHEIEPSLFWMVLDFGEKAEGREVLLNLGYDLGCADTPHIPIIAINGQNIPSSFANYLPNLFAIRREQLNEFLDIFCQAFSQYAKFFGAADKVDGRIRLRKDALDNIKRSMGSRGSLIEARKYIRDKGISL